MIRLLLVLNYVCIDTEINFIIIDTDVCICV